MKNLFAAIALLMVSTLAFAQSKVQTRTVTTTTVTTEVSVVGGDTITTTRTVTTTTEEPAPATTQTLGMAAQAFGAQANVSVDTLAAAYQKVIENNVDLVRKYAKALGYASAQEMIEAQEKAKKEAKPMMDSFFDLLDEATRYLRAVTDSVLSEKK